jgi:hypothetical protein
MNYEVKLSVVRRKGGAGRKVISPFINGWNVWDIPEKHWTEEVQNAIEHAYQLGRHHAMTQIKKEIDVAYSSPTGNWGDVKDAT